MATHHAHEPLNGQLMRVPQGMTDGGTGARPEILSKNTALSRSWFSRRRISQEHTDRFLTIINRLLRKDAMELRGLVLDASGSLHAGV